MTQIMPSEPRIVRGSCFDCAEVCDCAQYVWMCACHFRDGDQTEPTPKLDGNAWPDERPTEPGEYWVALHPDQRERLYASQPLMCVALGWNCGGFLAVRWFDSDRQECSLSLEDLLFDGAKWSRRETPADPFEEVKT